MNWSSVHPALVGAITIVLVWSDWLLTVLQEREKRAFHSRHYQSYPIDTTEGSPFLQRAVGRGTVRQLRHGLIALLIGLAVALAFMIIPVPWRAMYLGYVWGIFLVVDTAHVSNLLGYRASRRGLHGKLLVHQRTGYLIQAGRHLALAMLLIVVTLATASSFVGGMAVAGLTSSVRQMLWLRRVPPYGADDRPPDEASRRTEEGFAPPARVS